MSGMYQIAGIQLPFPGLPLRRVLRAKRILGLSLPIAFALIVQNIMSLISIAMVGQLGDFALAGVGVANAIYMALLATLFGMDTGVQAVVARKMGAGEEAEIGKTLNDAIVLSAAAGIVLSIFAIVVGPLLLQKMIEGEGILDHALPFLFGSALALLFMGANFTFIAYWNGIGRPEYSLWVSIFQLFASVFWSYALIFGEFGLPRLETFGAGLGATVAAFLALVVHVALSYKWVPAEGFLKSRPTFGGMESIFRIGMPVSVQQCSLYIGITVFYALITRLGAAEVAAANVMTAIMLLSILPATGFGIAAATLVANALGKGRVPSAQSWGWESGVLSAVFNLPLCIVLLVMPETVLRLLIVNVETVELASTPMRIFAIAMCVDAFGRVLSFSLRGAGATVTPTTIAFVLQWCVQLPLVWYVAVNLGYGLLAVAFIQLLQYGIETILLSFVWYRGFWHRAKVSFA